jgi:diguanylate cyclase (GGDEF)-like protein
MLEMHALLESSRTLIRVLLPFSTVVAALWVGPWALVLALCGLAFAVAPKLVPRVRHPEWVLLAPLVVFVVTWAITISQTGGIRSPLIFWILFYMVGVAARLNGRALMVATVLGAIAAIAAVVAGDPGHLGADLPALVTLLAVCAVSARYMHLLTHVEFGHREAAQLDSLTGLLNRKALESRFDELRKGAALTGQAISLIVCDLDHFKLVNDEHGHDRGDAVLRDVAVALRQATRSSELIYRVGGEEFVVLLPGIEPDDAADVAERLRSAVAAALPGGLALTASIGYATAHGEGIRFGELFRAADGALYLSKAAGRDRATAATSVVTPAF